MYKTLQCISDIAAKGGQYSQALRPVREDLLKLVSPEMYGGSALALGGVASRAAVRLLGEDPELTQRLQVIFAHQRDSLSAVDREKLLNLISESQGRKTTRNPLPELREILETLMREYASSVAENGGNRPSHELSPRQRRAQRSAADLFAGKLTEIAMHDPYVEDYLAKFMQPNMGRIFRVHLTKRLYLSGSNEMANVLHANSICERILAELGSRGQIDLKPPQ